MTNVDLTILRELVERMRGTACKFHESTRYSDQNVGDAFNRFADDLDAAITEIASPKSANERIVEVERGK